VTAPRGEKLGITTTVPVEVTLSAGMVPVDLNNLFVSGGNTGHLTELAHGSGFPTNACAWLKGIFGAVVAPGGPGRVVGVVRGDCSGTEVLLEALEFEGVEVTRFSYPLSRTRDDMERELERFAAALGGDLVEAERLVTALEAPRALLAELDELCWKHNLVTGYENHLWLVSASDFHGDHGRFTYDLAAFIDSVSGREPLNERPGLPFAREVRLGYLGVPPVSTSIFDLAEARGARFVFHEVPRQFSMPGRPGRGLVDLYLDYTYPYTLEGRARDISEQAYSRGLDGLVHYVQSFCYRNTEDVVFSRAFDLPYITVECDCPGEMGATAASRLENFIQVIGENL